MRRRSGGGRSPRYFTPPWHVRASVCSSCAFDQACAGDPVLREEVDSAMLAAHAEGAPVPAITSRCFLTHAAARRRHEGRPVSRVAQPIWRGAARARGLPGDRHQPGRRGCDRSPALKRGSHTSIAQLRAAILGSSRPQRPRHALQVGQNGGRDPRQHATIRPPGAARPWFNEATYPRNQRSRGLARGLASCLTVI